MSYQQATYQKCDRHRRESPSGYGPLMYLFPLTYKGLSTHPTIHCTCPIPVMGLYRPISITSIPFFALFQAVAKAVCKLPRSGLARLMEDDRRKLYELLLRTSSEDKAGETVSFCPKTLVRERRAEKAVRNSALKSGQTISASGD